jgi:hypothetical protein
MLFLRQTCWYYASDWGNGIDGAMLLLEASPYWSSGYDLAARCFNSGFLNLTERSQFTALRELARFVASWESMINDPLYKDSFAASDAFNPGQIHLCMAMANTILDNDEIAQKYIDLAVGNSDTLAWAAMLQAMLFTRQGNIAAANEILNHEVMANARESDIYQIMNRWR